MLAINSAMRRELPRGATAPLALAHIAEARDARDDAADRTHDVGRGERDDADAVGAHVVEVAALLAGHEIVDDDRHFGDARLGERPRSGLRDEQVGRAHERWYLVRVAEDRHRRRQRRRELFELRAQRGVAPGDDDQVQREARLGEGHRRRQQLAAAFAACHQQCDRLVARQTHRFADLELGGRDVLELRMDGMPDKAQALGRDAAFAGALVDLARRDDDRVDFRREPALVHLAEVGDDGDDRDIGHAGVGAGAQRRVVQQRMDRDDDVGFVAGEKAAQTLTIQRLTKTNDAAEASSTVGCVIQRPVNRRSEAERRTIRRAEMRKRERAMRGHVFDPMLEADLAGQLVERRDDRVGRAAMAASGIGDQQEDAFIRHRAGCCERMARTARMRARRRMALRRLRAVARTIKIHARAGAS